ncbi:hypothetical protein [Candidatus Kryptobacter tengchongensis]|uniref:Por secretion system C-terminal sorting domain-containing protein n=1 Tax=Kryptobacter tengchongensis TaxID=1643429 RepID=A0A916LJ97_KRYT1|nr:hypothetical protein [Candidatus Kryptobacter tengchongensis]CUT00370.1 hypothetical protein JGI25_00723 [Candidatus Kryptobacter tengchongensis]
MRRLIVLSGVFLLLVEFALAQTWQLVYKNKGVGTKDTIIAQLGPGRSVLVTDVNKDGIKEVYTTAYVGHKVIQFTVAGNDSVELTYIFPDQPSAYYSEPRDIEVGDLDGDGKLEIIYPVGRLKTDFTNHVNQRGYQVWEWNPSENKFDGPYVIIPDTGMTRFRPENFVVDDVDGDGKQELIHFEFAFGGASDGVYIISVEGDFESGFATVVKEAYFPTHSFAVIDGVERNMAVVSGTVADVDGDGKKEIWFMGNNLVGNETPVWFIKAVGPNTYEADTNKIVVLQSANSYPLKAVAKGDFDANGKDEVYFSFFRAVTTTESVPNTVYVIGNLDNVDNFDSTKVKVIYSDTTDRMFYLFNLQNVGNRYLVLGGYYVVYEAEFQGGSPLEPTSWAVSKIIDYDPVDSAAGAGWSGGIWRTGATNDLDGDGKPEIILFLQGITDSLNKYSENKVLRIYEKTVTGLKEWTVITPDDYELYQNYPNPFNPTTNISFYLPVDKKISLIIYDIAGREVVKLIDEQEFPKGKHTIVWDGKDKKWETCGKRNLLLQT